MSQLPLDASAFDLLPGSETEFDFTSDFDFEADSDPVDDFDLAM